MNALGNIKRGGLYEKILCAAFETRALFLGPDSVSTLSFMVLTLVLLVLLFQKRIR